MTGRTGTMGAIAAVLALLAGPSLAAPCWSSSEVRAAQVREMQTLMMVGALQCRHIAGNDALASYNRFVTRFRPHISSQNDVLKARFARLHGNGAGQNAYDRYTTSLANLQAARGAQTGFCEQVADVGRTLATLNDQDMQAMAARLVPAPASVECIE
ncbi:hypothetical protein [Parapedomonas caeni]